VDTFALFWILEAMFSVRLTMYLSCITLIVLSYDPSKPNLCRLVLVLVLVCDTGVWTQDFVLARQVLYCLNDTSWPIQDIYHEGSWILSNAFSAHIDFFLHFVGVRYYMCLFAYIEWSFHLWYKSSSIVVNGLSDVLLSSIC
jgi:hypothetical protein